MSNPVPSSLALSVINTNDPINSSPHRNNYSAIQTAVNALITCLSGGTAGLVLSAVDGSDVQWGIPSGGRIASSTKTASVSGSGSTFGTGTDILASAITFTADGTSSYVVRLSASGWASPGTGDQKILYLNLDSAAGGVMAVDNTPTGGYTTKCNGETIITTPSAGSHTVNVRIVSGAGSSVTVNGGAGGSTNNAPILVTIEKL